MEKEIKPGCSGGASNLLNNSGGPRSRVRSEAINESYLCANTAVHEGYYALDLPADVNVETWLLSFADELGWKSWDQVIENIALPQVKLLVFDEPGYEAHIRCYDNIHVLTTAIILSMCNPFCYLPHSPRIFTRSRLERKIKLTQINLKSFYELE